MDRFSHEVYFHPFIFTSVFPLGKVAGPAALKSRNTSWFSFWTTPDNSSGTTTKWEQASLEMYSFRLVLSQPLPAILWVQPVA